MTAFPPEADALVSRAAEVRAHAHAPYSAFRVGAALLGPSGAIHVGVNVENAAYPLGICAEQAAIAAGVTAGERGFEVVCVVTDADPPAMPCGGCRQVLHELNPEMLVIAANLEGERRLIRVRELLPHAFSGAALPKLTQPP